MSKKILSVFLCAVLFAAICAGCTSQQGDGGVSGTKEITDMAGRTVTIPSEIKSVFSLGATGTIALYTIEPDLLVGVNYEFNEKESEFILEKYRDLPSFGQGKGLNQEAVISAAPDICITYGSINDSEISAADSFQEQTNIPVVMVDGALESAPDAYRFLGGVLGLDKRCGELAEYSQKALDFAAKINVPKEKQTSVYYGNGEKSLETSPVGSSHAELFGLVKANNVAVVEGKISTRIEVSPEQIIGWNPEVIIINGEPKTGISPTDAVEAFKADERYKNVKAVANNKVFAIPKYPYSWFDRPPAANRLIGIYWLADILYPDLADIDIKKEAKDFYSLFYHMKLSDEQLASLLGE